jgi:uncharacterized protein (TIGR03437 family)
MIEMPQTVSVRSLALFAIAPVGLLAHSYGPPPRVTGGAGDNARACTACHTTNPLNSVNGSVKVLLQGGQFYVPGVKQRITVQVSEPNQQRWGFELSARLNSDLEKGQAGDFAPVDNLTQVICEDNTPKPCASGPLFITHTSAGTRNGTPGGASFQFDWTPPATNVGPVTFFVAGNAANGNGAPTGDFIYTSSMQLAPAVASAPTLAANGVVHAATGVAGPVTPNCWVTIYGTNLSATTRAWTDGDFVDGQIPFALDGVSVVLTQFGAPRLAYVGYVSATQVNFLLPSDTTITATTVAVKNPAGITTSAPLTLQALPGELFTSDGKTVLATHASGALLGKSSPAVPGETISLFGTGMGATSPALIPGQVPTAASPLATLPKVTIGGTAATVAAGVVVPGSAGVYQLRVQVPADAANGDLPVVVQSGTSNSAAATITVQK